MLNNFNFLLNNIKSIDNNTIIIITCLNGNLIEQKISKNNGRYEIIHGDEPLYGVYDMNEYLNNFKKIMVYFKGVYCIENGYIEYLVNPKWLIKQFSNIGYTLITNHNFLNVYKQYLIDLKNNLSDKHKKVCELHTIFIFKKNYIY